MSKRDETTAATAWLSCDLAVFARLGLATRAAGEHAPAETTPADPASPAGAKHRICPRSAPAPRGVAVV